MHSPAEARKLWITALRSGKYKQGKFRLHLITETGDELCCLGVACKVAKENGVPLEVCTVPHDQGTAVLYNGSKAALPNVVVEWLGLTSSDGMYENTRLTTQNDRVGLTFDQIADIIESEPEDMFETRSDNE